MADSPTPAPTPTPLDPALLMAGLAALGVSTPESLTGFLTAASRLIQRELLTSQIAAAQARARQQAQDSAAEQQALQQQVAALQAQIGG